MLKYIKNISKLFNTNFYVWNNTYSHISPDLVRYYKTEYGNDWKAALEYDQFKKGLENENAA
jgi:hypothetical protein|tara:strand:+ start:488 stop:673 length:186 start_codon:yes stop_codon:yes gene_type:complete